jgi:hypothetical protein
VQPRTGRRSRCAVGVDRGHGDVIFPHDVEVVVDILCDVNAPAVPTEAA